MSDSVFAKMTKDLKSVLQLQEFAEAQHKTIIDLSKKLTKIEQENAQLKLSSPLKEPITISGVLDISSEEVICHTQLAMLKERSLMHELTLEEAKKVDIYSKILNTLKNKPKDESDIFKNKTDEELLKLINTNE